MLLFTNINKLKASAVGHSSKACSMSKLLNEVLEMLFLCQFLCGKSVLPFLLNGSTWINQFMSV